MDRRQAMLGGALGAAGLLGMALQPRARAEDRLDGPALESMLPDQVGAYRLIGTEGLVLPPQTPASERAYTDVATRLYRADGQAIVMLLVARGRASSPGLSVHRPDRCYPAAGFSVSPTREVPLSGPVPSGAQAGFMTARRAAREEQVYFWTRVGDRFPASGWDQRMATIRANLRGEMPATVLGRLSLVGSDVEAGLAQLEAFNAAWLGALSPDARALILGR